MAMDLIDAFIDQLSKEGKNEKTIIAYSQVLRVFSDWGAEKRQSFSLNNISTTDLQSWVEEMQEKQDLAPSTVKKRISIVRAFYRYLKDNGHINADDSLSVPAKRVPEDEPRWLTKTEQAKLLESIKTTGGDDWLAVRDTAIALTMIYAGLRVFELVELRVEDVDFQNNTITVRQGKWGEGRDIPLDPELKKSLKLWLAIRETEPGEEVMFIGQRKKNPLLIRSVPRILRPYMIGIGLSDMTVNALRHTYGKRLADRGTPPKEVALYMGIKHTEGVKGYFG